MRPNLIVPGAVVKEISSCALKVELVLREFEVHQVMVERRPVRS